MQTHSTNLVNGHHHEMQITTHLTHTQITSMQMPNHGGQIANVNGYGMNLKQEPDVNY